MDTSGRYLATGGGDDRVAVIDLKLNRDVHVSYFLNRLFYIGPTTNCVIVGISISTV